jgi:Ca2+-binding RTX toxin-like protein
LDGGAGRDLAVYALAAGALTADLSSALAQDTGGAGVDRFVSVEDFIAGDFADFIHGSASDNDLRGRDGGDYLYGAGGLDHLHGEEGDDTLDGGAGDDALFGGNGADTASYASASAGVAVSLAAPGAQWTAGAGWDLLSQIENLTGSGHADALTGTDGANVIRDLGGSDTVSAGGGADLVIAGVGGNDVYDGGDGADTVSYAEQALAVNVDLQAGTSAGFSAAFDTLISFSNVTGGAGGDTLRGTGGANALRGGDGDDALDGRGGADLLFGGAGDDTLTGGAGADVFAFRLGDGTDAIVGFTLGVDLIRFDNGPDSFADLDLSGPGVGYGSGGLIMLASVDLAALSASDFVFA